MIALETSSSDDARCAGGPCCGAVMVTRRSSHAGRVRSKISQTPCDEGFRCEHVSDRRDPLSRARASDTIRRHPGARRREEVAMPQTDPVPRLRRADRAAAPLSRRGVPARRRARRPRARRPGAAVRLRHRRRAKQTAGDVREQRTCRRARRSWSSPTGRTTSTRRQARTTRRSRTFEDRDRHQGQLHRRRQRQRRVLRQGQATSSAPASRSAATSSC